MNDGRLSVGLGAHHPATPAAPGPHDGHARHLPHGAGPAPALKPPSAEEIASIELVDDSGTDAVKSKIRAFGTASINAAHEFKRSPHANHTGAVRVRSFHGRLSEQGLEYLDNAINDWLDRHADVEVKFVTSTVGLFDGKIKEPALVLNVWY